MALSIYRILGVSFILLTMAGCSNTGPYQPLNAIGSKTLGSSRQVTTTTFSSPTTTLSGSPTTTLSGSPTTTLSGSPTTTLSGSPTTTRVPDPGGGNPCANAPTSANQFADLFVAGADAPPDSVSPAGGWHVSLFNDVKTAVACRPIVWSENSILWGQRGTANFRIMFAAAHYLHSIRFGTPAQKLKARNRVIELFKIQEQTFGHMALGGNANEQFVLDPHTNFWIGSLVEITWGAWESNDTTIIDYCNRWWGTHLYWLKQSWSGGETRIPGTRLPDGSSPSWDVDTKVYKLTQGIYFRSGGGEWASILMMRDLLTKYRSSIPKNYSSGKLTMPLHFEPKSYGHVMWMERPTQGLPLTPVDWVKSYAPDRGAYYYGRSWNTPVPQ